MIFHIWIWVQTGLTCGFPLVHFLHYMHNPLPIILACLFTFTSSLMLALASIGNPGYLPKVNSTQKEDTWMCSQVNLMVIKGQVMLMKYCWTCNIIRPPWSVHCKDCDMCVERYDHHCPFLGICVGKRNFSYFFLYIATQFLYGSYVTIVCAIQIIHHSITFIKPEKVGLRIWYWIKISPLSVPSFFSGIFIVCITLTLFPYYIKIIILGRTTNEDIKIKK